MFAGTKRMRSSNVRVMQIFHELKAQFPTVPDHIITACIASHLAADSNGNLHDLVLATAAKDQQNHQMGRPSIELETSPYTTPTPTASIAETREISADMSVSDLVKNNETIKSYPVKHLVKRPNTLDINNDRKLQLSEKCRDVHKLLNSPILVDKPPKSPLSSKRFAAKQVPKLSTKKETVSTPTQTTDTLVNNPPITNPSLNLSLNVNCQMGLVQSPTKPKCTTRVELTPTQPWLNPTSSFQDSTSPRSFTSVNLTLRPPTSTPQDPIDITSQNSSLTYSTSSFDKEKGLQSRLQITVGPGNAGSVSSVRTRPRSFPLGNSSEQEEEDAATRTGSLNNLTAVNLEAPVLVKQQARIDRMKIELQTDTARLVIMRREVEELENKRRQATEKRTAEEIEKQLKLEIKHLTFQCEQLADRLDQNQFYNNIYSGPTGPLLASQPSRYQRQSSRTSQVVRRPQRGRFLDFPDTDDSRWNCSVCTFLNHPDLDKCEQCDMPRVFHVSAAPGDNIHIHVTPRLSRRIAHSWVL